MKNILLQLHDKLQQATRQKASVGKKGVVICRVVKTRFQSMFRRVEHMFLKSLSSLSTYREEGNV